MFEREDARRVLEFFTLQPPGELCSVGMTDNVVEAFVVCEQPLMGATQLRRVGRVDASGDFDQDASVFRKPINSRTTARGFSSVIQCPAAAILRTVACFATSAIINFVTDANALCSPGRYNSATELNRRTLL